MKLLDFLERSVERVIQGPVDSIFRQDIQPSEIERHLERAMLDNRRRASGANIMPNTYVVGLSPEDFSVVESYRVSLVRRLESWLATRADVHDGALLDRISITLEQDDRARRRRPIVSATITDIGAAPGPPPAMPGRRRDQPTELFRVANSAVSLRLLTGPQSGTSFSLPEGTTILGRASDSDIRVDAPDVSRHHVRISRRGTRVDIADLGSTNGTRVNGERCTHATLRNGDEILVGAQALRFVTT